MVLSFSQFSLSVLAISGPNSFIKSGSFKTILDGEIEWGGGWGVVKEKGRHRLLDCFTSEEFMIFFIYLVQRLL